MFLEYFTYSQFNFQVQTLKIEIEEDSFVGMPFVLLSQGNWIKNGGSDFYIEFRVGPKQVKKVALCCNPNKHFFLSIYLGVSLFTSSYINLLESMTIFFFPQKDAGDGKGTAKALLGKIAEKESEAQKSFMHRSVIPQDVNELSSTLQKGNLLHHFHQYFNLIFCAGTLIRLFLDGFEGS